MPPLFGRERDSSSETRYFLGRPLGYAFNPHLRPGARTGIQTPADSRRPQRGEKISPFGFSLDRWWETPDLRIFPGTQQQGNRPYVMDPTTGQPQYIEVPAWGRFDYDRPEDFYAFTQRATPSELDTLRSGGLARMERQRALEALTGSREAVSGMLGRFQEDPTRAAIQTALTERAAPGYRATSELEESALVNQIAQAAARNLAMRRAEAAARGVGGVGPASVGDATLRGQANAAALQLRANIEASNEAQRTAALGNLESYSTRSYAMEDQMIRALAAIDDRIAQIREGSSLMPTDFVAFDLARFGMDQYTDELEFRRQALAGLEEQNRWGLQDWLNLALTASGSGAYEWLF